jgi:CubicO group peptidase (beta-lactamase class C family)
MAAWKPDGLRPATPTGVLAGTAEDYGRFAQMLAGGGQLDGRRLLGRKTVELMASNHIGRLPLAGTMSDMRGYRFGLGVRVLDDPAEAATLASRGTFGWAGAFGTNSWIDPVEGLVGVMLIQRMTDPADPVLRTLWPRFQATAYQALDD